MKKPRKVLIATKTDDFRFPDPSAAERAGIQFEYAPHHALGALNGKALELSALVLEIDAGSPDALREFEGLAEALPGRAVIAATPSADSGDIRRLFRAGAADVVASPLAPETLLNALVDVLEPGRSGAESPKGQVISVIKAAGGAGATTVALNLARLFCGGTGGKRPAERRTTCVLDLDLQFGDTDVALNLEPRSTVVDVIQAQERFDGRFLEGVLTQHESGIRLLGPAPSLVPLDAISTRFALSLLDAAARAHEITMVDLPGSWTDWTVPVLARSDLIVLVAPSNVAGVAGARRVLDGLQEGGVTAPVFFVVSKLAGFADALEKPGRIGKTLALPVDAGLAFDSQAVRAADRGKLIVDAFPNTRLSKDLRSASQKIQQKLAAAASLNPTPAGAHP